MRDPAPTTAPGQQLRRRTRTREFPLDSLVERPADARAHSWADGSGALWGVQREIKRVWPEVSFEEEFVDYDTRETICEVRNFTGDLSTLLGRFSQPGFSFSMEDGRLTLVHSASQSAAGPPAAGTGVTPAEAEAAEALLKLASGSPGNAERTEPAVQVYGDEEGEGDGVGAGEARVRMAGHGELLRWVLALVATAAFVWANREAYARLLEEGHRRAPPLDQFDLAAIWTRWVGGEAARQSGGGQDEELDQCDQ